MKNKTIVIIAVIGWILFLLSFWFLIAYMFDVVYFYEQLELEMSFSDQLCDHVNDQAEYINNLHNYTYNVGGERFEDFVPLDCYSN